MSLTAIVWYLILRLNHYCFLIFFCSVFLMYFKPWVADFVLYCCWILTLLIKFQSTIAMCRAKFCYTFGYIWANGLPIYLAKLCCTFKLANCCAFFKILLLQMLHFGQKLRPKDCCIFAKLLLHFLADWVSLLLCFLCCYYRVGC